MSIAYQYYFDPEALGHLPFSDFRQNGDGKKTDFHFFKVTKKLWQCNDRREVFDPVMGINRSFQGAGETWDQAFAQCKLAREEFCMQLLARSYSGLTSVLGRLEADFPSTTRH